MAKRETFIPEIEGCSQFRGYLLVDPRNPANYRISNNVLCWTDGKKDFYAKLYPDCYPAELKGVVWEEHRNYQEGE